MSRKSKKPRAKLLIMGILNVTPDSFADGGKFYGRAGVRVDAVVKRALEMVEAGADVIDVGGESSGPGSKDVSLKEELKRVMPVVQKLVQLRTRRSFLISVDTYKAEVARQALEAGADMINDVTALRGDPDMASALAKFKDVPVVIMYSKDPTARTTREKVQYDDVIKTVSEFLQGRIEVGMKAGIARERFVIDPGMGAFVSADPKYSMQILKRLREFESFGLPILVGASRKGFIGEVLGEILKTATQEAPVIASKEGSFTPLPAQDRLYGSLACAAVAVMNGASILRVHDVKETRQVRDMIEIIFNS